MRTELLLIATLWCNFGSGIDIFTQYDGEIHPESATFGVSSRHDEFPFMTALGWKKDDSDEIDYLCGGMLISMHFVLTAAHCVFFEGELPNVIKIGGNNLNSTYNEDHTLRSYFIHPRYDETQAYNDIALLLLAKASRKRPVCLWARYKLITSRVIAIGYGATVFAGNRTTMLQKVNLVAVPVKLCGVYHQRKRKFPFGLLDSQLCAGDPLGRQDTCQGDSGGPLIVTTGYQQYAVGIISNGQACFGFPPSIYTRIASFLRWIISILSRFRTPKLKICY